MSQCAWAISAYTYGPLIRQLSIKCDKLVNGNEEEQTKPAPMPDPITPSTPADKSITSVKTGDDAVIALTVSSLIISGGMYLFIRKES